MASQAGIQRTPSVHSIQLDEEEQLRIALALSAEEAGLVGCARSTDEDERLARQLQEQEYAEARHHQQAHARAVAVPPPPPGGPPPLPQLHVPPPPSPLGSGLPGVTGLPAQPPARMGSGLVGGLRQASAEALQRISSGSREVWQGLRRMAEPSPVPHASPYYQPPAMHAAGPQHPYARPAPVVQGMPARPGPLPAQVSSQPPQQQQPLNDDEALAAALQRQFDLEERRWQAPVQGQHGGPPPAWQQPAAAGPLGANLAATTAAAAGAGGRPPVAAAPPAAPLPRPPQPPPPAAAPQRPPSAVAARSDLSRCAGCGGSLVGLLGARSPYIAALGRRWHPGCLVCTECARPIGERGGVPFCEREGRLYHLDCHKARFHPKCEVCAEYCPEEANRRIVWSEVPFWRQRFCPEHAYDGTPRCASCERLRPHAQAGDWAELEDGRQLCLPCLGTIVTDTHDAQPLWHSVLRFFEGMGMRLSPVPPMMLVDVTALNEAESQETGGQGRGVGPVFHVRGLTLTEEYASIRTVLRIPGGNPFAVRREAVPVGPTLCEVTGILVLYGLPRLLTGSILAHECMHAWLRMGGVTSHQRLAEQTEEGLCQLMAYLWLEAQQAETGFQDEHEERLAAYFAHQIRADTSPTYGDGFRAAHEAFQVMGLAPLVEHVQRLGALPPL